MDTATQAPAAPAAADNISGLRKQILANALFLYPNVVKQHLAYHKTSIAIAKDIFYIVMEGKNSHLSAMLLYGDPVNPKTAICGPFTKTASTALESLLQTTASLIGLINSGGSTRFVLGNPKFFEGADVDQAALVQYGAVLK